MEVSEKFEQILKEGYICDHCLGRQFAQLLSGFTNKERGKILRTVAAMVADTRETPMDMSNFHDFTFHTSDIKPGKRKKCIICKNVFEKIEKYAEKIIRISKKYEFDSFLVGTRLSYDLVEREERLWETVGIDYCEPIKSEINREIGKIVEKKLKKGVNFANPDVTFLVHIPGGKVETNINPIFIYGEYQKLVRGIPQTKWPSRKYKTSVEQIIAKPFMKVTKGKVHKLHGAGREDIDAKCFGWRPFVLEILEPKKRNINLRQLQKKVNASKKVKVRKLRKSDIKEVRRIKEKRLEKTYRVLVETENEIMKADLKKLSALVGTIKQRTPSRVLHRRANRLRKRTIKSIRVKYLDKKHFELFTRTQSGLYIKELVTGDNGRTNPNVSQILGVKCTPKELDVLKIHT
jgi:tRNA pseudouridine synthase 10